MALSADTVAKLKACNPLLKDNRERVGTAFYARLFAEAPQVQPMFEPMSRVPELALALSDALIAFTASCDNLSSLQPFVDKVAAKHVKKGVTPEMFTIVGGVLLGALEEVLGSGVFNADVKKAMTEGYGALSGMFIETEKRIAGK